MYHNASVQQKRQQNLALCFAANVGMVLNITLLNYIVLRIKGMEGRERELVNTNMKRL